MTTTHTHWGRWTRGKGWTYCTCLEEDRIMTTDNATPRPWAADGSLVIRPDGTYQDSSGRSVVEAIVSAEKWHSEGEANAALIVRAVNAHDQLVAALEALTSAVRKNVATAELGITEQFAQAEAALKRATEVN